MFTGGSTSSYTLVYLYDEYGSPIGFRYRTPSYSAGVFDGYFFEKNIQGDVIGIWDQNGTKVVSYVYDAWGNVTVSGTGASGIGAKNPFRYRGYYFDTETGLYYLQTRYYNPSWGRFINADGQFNGCLLGFNQFVYCNNNPVNLVDDQGDSPFSFILKLLILEVVAAIVVINMPSKEEHYARNSNQEETIESFGITDDERIEYIKSNWTAQEKSKNIYHINTNGVQGEEAINNIKYLSPDKKMEVVICVLENDQDYIVYDSLNRGTYNFGTNWFDHFAKDMVPYYLWGNAEDDSSFAGFPRRILGAPISDALGW